MEVFNVCNDNINLFSKILIESAIYLDSINQSMWKAEDLSVENLLLKYDIEDMKLCYENGNLIGVYILQWYDSLFWSELNPNETGILHKLAVADAYRKKGFGKTIIKTAEQFCLNKGIHFIRLNCGTKRLRLRNFYESVGFQKVDRVFIDNRNQIRYIKEL